MPSMSEPPARSLGPSRADEPGASTRSRRNAARREDRSLSIAVSGAFALSIISALFWARRLIAPTAQRGALIFLLSFVTAASVVLVVAWHLDLTAHTNALTRRLRLERRVARWLRTLDVVTLHDRVIIGASTPLSHILVSAKLVIVLVDVSQAQSAPWRPVAGGSSQTRRIRDGWIEASTAAAILQRALSDNGAPHPPPAVLPAVVTDMRELPLWAQRLTIYHFDDLPTRLVAMLEKPGQLANDQDAPLVAAKIRSLTTPATATV